MQKCFYRHQTNCELSYPFLKTQVTFVVHGFGDKGYIFSKIVVPRLFVFSQTFPGFWISDSDLPEEFAPDQMLS
jgi:hypothetical protein